ncbi:MAG TPA: acetyl-CoA carboxylase biotin carboxyl carrier protein [Rhizomicrobium sp.]|jgi:acetyl-CoA carboxylase biotin carboxyl carrier protein|nr:acetyl-CoA carboxylase biotin carboxyl carrier protein [Rhizomicrobium sp.]
MNMKDLGQRITNGSRKEKTNVDSDAIRELASLLRETELTEIEVEHNGMRLRVVRAGVHAVSHAVPIAATTVTAAAPADAAKPSGPAAGAVPSPMVGTVYVSPEPGKPPFVKVGDTVKEGATLMIIEAMKTMNPILAPRSGTVTEICIDDAQPVEFGQSLLILA